MTTNITLDRGRQAAPQLYELFREKIVSLDLAPGFVLSRAKLANTYDVSQTPVREALLRLAEERLVDVFPQSSTRVSLIDVSFAQETHFLRRAVELEVVREVALNRDEALINRLKEQLEQQKKLLDAKDLAGFTQADRDFHQSLYRWVGKEELWHLICSRSGDLDRVRRLHLPFVGKRDRIIDEHRQLFQAIVDQDPDRAQQCLRVHMSGTPKYIAKIQAEHPSFFKQV
ncbi:GntR family transcriptional regulator [Paenalcaligenes niemegkensis]|uniref:GntR family transcriptional regulator n=1 Tax=Paenalcaligenes niemegkensis TaxID=2895469 RepID=UPI001EE8BE4B|nr:GntR family transcriptional regulator [Paenalcaligenes niemegkensis]MCQ9618100.1 GntR family transcriptional regulator [Paenalcaligenes niemegkensis]